MQTKVDFKWLHPSKTVSRFVDNRAVGMFLAETCAKHMNPYVPMDTGMLSQNYTTEPFKVTYNQPYANYQYRGRGFNFKRNMHPLATSYWDKAMANKDKPRIAKELSAFIQRSCI